jgi:hypothetical protein
MLCVILLSAFWLNGGLMLTINELHIWIVNVMIMWAHSSVWIEWLPAEQLVEGSSPSGPALRLIRVSIGFI